MKKILVLPLFQMPSGHHHVADSLIDTIKQNDPNIECKKMDFLHYVSPRLEKMVTSFYLRWINVSPESYNIAYKRFSFTSDERQNISLTFYEKMFLKKMLILIHEEQPDLIICTHGFPSFLVSKLKEQSLMDIPVINAYTDFFINSVWGKKGVDYHLAPTQSAKKYLIEKHNVGEHQIKVTGVPVHQAFETTTRKRKDHNHSTLLLAGGSSGLGDIIGFLKPYKEQKQSVRFIILCGKNETLYKEIKSWNNPRFIPKKYVSSKVEMNMIYDQADAIITKPGGVTVSEAIKKNIPIFVHSALPGQEYVNLKFLQNKLFVQVLSDKQPYVEQVLAVIEDKEQRTSYKNTLFQYKKELEIKDHNELQVYIQSILRNHKTSQRHYVSIALENWKLITRRKKPSMTH